MSEHEDALDPHRSFLLDDLCTKTWQTIICVCVLIRSPTDSCSSAGSPENNTVCLSFRDNVAGWQRRAAKQQLGNCSLPGLANRRREEEVTVFIWSGLPGRSVIINWQTGFTVKRALGGERVESRTRVSHFTPASLCSAGDVKV